MTWQELKVIIDAKLEGVEGDAERRTVAESVKWVLRNERGHYIALVGVRSAFVPSREMACVYDGTQNEELTYNFFRSIMRDGALSIELWEEVCAS